MNHGNHAEVQKYYNMHAKVYDATRWAFLFGRERLTRLLACELGGMGGSEPGSLQRILEVGCGTGKNLARLARALPQARMVGVDLCAPMLDRAGKALAAHGDKIDLRHTAYSRTTLPEASCDAVVFSYSLSMFNPGYQKALDAALEHVRPGGAIAVVDFKESRHAWFRSWMEFNHVRLDDHLLSALVKRFTPKRLVLKSAYAGLWDYFLFLGRKA